MDLFSIIKDQPKVEPKKEPPKKQEIVIPKRSTPYPTDTNTPRFKLINALYNLEANNTKNRAELVIELSSDMDEPEVNKLFAQYAPNTCNKILNAKNGMDKNQHMNHLRSLTQYVRK